MITTTQHPLKREQTGPIAYGEQFHSACMG